MMGSLQTLALISVCALIAAPGADAAKAAGKAKASSARQAIVLPDVRKIPAQTSGFPAELNKAIAEDRWSDALPQLEKLAADGMPEAKGAYAMVLLRGLGGIQPDVKRARLLLEDAANRGDLNSQRNLAQMLFIGAFDKGTPNYPGAWTMIEKLTEKHDPVGMYLASKYFVDGLLGVRNPPVGLALLKDAAIAGSRNAQYDMALLYRRGMGNPPVPNLGMATFWFAHAASNAHPLGMYEFGMANLLGLGAKRNIPQGVEWLTRAADTGNSNAQVALAAVYYGGQGVPKDEAKAMLLLDKAAAQMNGGAYMMKGKLKADSAKTPEDKAEAYYFLSIAEVLGARQSSDVLNKLRIEVPRATQELMQKRIVDWRLANNINAPPRLSQPVD